MVELHHVLSEKFPNVDPYVMIASVTYEIPVESVSLVQRDRVKNNMFLYAHLYGAEEIDTILCYVYAGKFIHYGAWPQEKS